MWTEWISFAPVCLVYKARCLTERFGIPAAVLRILMMRQGDTHRLSSYSTLEQYDEVI